MCFSYPILQRTFSVLLLLAVFVDATGFSWQPLLSQHQDITRINGLDAPIVIARDAAGVPDIRAASERDAQFGLGYAHAQDRLWQMEWQRRLASGRTAEFLGAPGLKADVLAVHARKLMPILLRTTPPDQRSRQALDLLRTWDFRATGDSAAAAVFEAWYIRIAQRLFADELGDLWLDYGRAINMVGMATETALVEQQAWCDDVKTPTAETSADTLAAALADGLADMATAQGTDDLAAWRWDRVHRAQFMHQPLGANLQTGSLFNRSIPNSGDRFTVNVASSFRRWEDYDQLHAAQYRQIVDLGDLPASRWIVAPGQGGDPNTPHYDDLLARWQRVEYLPMR